MYLNGLAALADRIYFKKIVFTQIAREQVKSQCRSLTLKSCTNLQNLDHTKLQECQQVHMEHCELLRDNLKVYGEKLRSLTIKHTFSVDGLVAKWIAFESPFKRLVELDLSYNQIEFPALVFLLH
jgi:hypothetical protein